MNDTLTHAFKGMDPEDHRVRRILMVGAHPDEEKGRPLSRTDRSLLRYVVMQLEALKIPMSESVYANTGFEHNPAPSVVRPICILEEYGAENFLESEEKGDAVVLCNISKEDRFGDTGLPELRKSFQSAKNHDDMKAWNAQLLNTGAKMVFIFGIDNFEVQDFSQEDFIKIKLDGPLTGILVRRTFFEEAAYFLLENNSPLAPVIAHYDDPSIIFHMESPSLSGTAVRALRP